MRCCMHTKSHGLNMMDVIRTEKLALKCGKAIIRFSAKSKVEPALPKYCAQEPRIYVPTDEGK